jgi:hypothetical protein
VHVTDRFDPVNRIKAREALVNCLLLARCRALIRTASFLSGWASVFNPELSVIMLNRPYQEALWFPDREVLRHESTRVFADRAAG